MADFDKPLSPGERIATAIVDYLRVFEKRREGRNTIGAYKNLVRTIDEVLAAHR